MRARQSRILRGRRGARRTCIIVAVGLLLSGGAHAQQARSDAERPYTHPRAQIGLGTYVAIPTRDGDLDPGPGVQVRGGYRINRWVGAEAIGEYLIRLAGPGDTYRWGWAAGVQSRGYVAPQLGWIQPYVLAGMTAFESRRRGGGDTDAELGFALRGGVGVELFTRDDFAVLLETTYVRPFLDPEGLDYVALGIGFQWQ